MEPATDKGCLPDTSNYTEQVGQLEQRDCGFCDVGNDYQQQKDVALLIGDMPAAAEADALLALAEDAAVIAHGFDSVDPQFGGGHE